MSVANIVLGSMAALFATHVVVSDESREGLETAGNQHEQEGRIDEAEASYRSIRDRFEEPAPLAAFYARHARSNPRRYAAKAAEWRKKVFNWPGQEPTSLADFVDPPQHGVRFNTEWPKPWGMRGVAIVTAVDGQRVYDAQQYLYVRDLTRSRDIRLIVWDGDTWRELSGQFRHWPLGTPQTYARPRVDSLDPVAETACPPSVSARSAEDCIWYAALYASGDGSRFDKRKAAELYRRACTAGNKLACAELRAMTRRE